MYKVPDSFQQHCTPSFMLMLASYWHRENNCMNAWFQ